MSAPTAVLFVDAVHTANALEHAVVWGLVVAAALCVFVAPVVTAGVVWGVKALWEALSGRLRPEEPVPVPESPRTRPAPSWARPNSHRYDEVA